MVYGYINLIKIFKPEFIEIQYKIEIIHCLCCEVSSLESKRC